MSGRFRLPGGVGLVTGAASGIGAALSAGLAARGCALVLVDRDADGLARSAAAAERAGVAVEARVADLADAEAIRALPAVVEARFGHLDLLVNNAGVALGGRFEDAHLDDVAWLMNVNLCAVVRMCHAFLPMLRARPAAQIVNVSSVFGLIAPPGHAAYCASKFAVRGFSEALGHEYAGTGLGVSVVCPGGVATGIARNARVPRPPADPEAAASVRALAEAGRRDFEKLLRMPPETAAGAIIRGVEARAPRIVIGRDARVAALIQRLMPVGYWTAITRLSKGM